MSDFPQGAGAFRVYALKLVDSLYKLSFYSVAAYSAAIFMLAIIAAAVFYKVVEVPEFHPR